MHANLPIPFWKMNGAGNDFIVIDHRKPLIPVERMAEFARLVCRRKFSVGADGLFLLEPSQRAVHDYGFGIRWLSCCAFSRSATSVLRLE